MIYAKNVAVTNPTRLNQRKIVLPTVIFFFQLESDNQHKN